MYKVTATTRIDWDSKGTEAKQLENIEGIHWLYISGHFSHGY